MKRNLYIACIFIVLLTCVACGDDEVKNTNTNEDIAEANVVSEGQKSQETQQKDGTSSASETQEVTAGGKVNINDTIKNQVLALAPGLNEYKAEVDISEQIKFKFVYYGLSSLGLGAYQTKDIQIEGESNTWALVPKADVESKFMEVFGRTIGEYEPKLNEDDPTVYYANGFYYICTSAAKDTINYSIIGAEDSVVKIKEAYEGDERYNEIHITLASANNSSGFVITKVISIPK